MIKTNQNLGESDLSHDDLWVILEERRKLQEELESKQAMEAKLRKLEKIEQIKNTDRYRNWEITNPNKEFFYYEEWDRMEIRRWETLIKETKEYKIWITENPDVSLSTLIDTCRSWSMKNSTKDCADYINSLIKMRRGQKQESLMSFKEYQGWIDANPKGQFSEFMFLKSEELRKWVEEFKHQMSERKRIYEENMNIIGKPSLYYSVTEVRQLWVFSLWEDSYNLWCQNFLEWTNSDSLSSHLFIQSILSNSVLWHDEEYINWTKEYRIWYVEWEKDFKILMGKVETKKLNMEKRYASKIKTWENNLKIVEEYQKQKEENRKQNEENRKQSEEKIKQTEEYQSWAIENPCGTLNDFKEWKTGKNRKRNEKNRKRNEEKIKQTEKSSQTGIDGFKKWKAERDVKNGKK